MKYSMKRVGFFALLLIFLSGSATAQDVYTSSGKKLGTKSKREEHKGFDPQRLVIGGGINLGFGTITNIGVSPTIGYRITDKFLAGVGLGFQYYSYKDFYHFYNSSTGEDEYYPLRATLYYPSVWARYLVFQNIFAHVEGEYDIQRLSEYGLDPATSYPTKVTTNYNSPALLVGAGLRQPISDRSSLVIMALYDVIQDKYSPYLNRIDIRIGFNAGF